MRTVKWLWQQYGKAVVSAGEFILVIHVAFLVAGMLFFELFWICKFYEWLCGISR